MNLILLIVIPLVGGIFAWVAARWSATLSRVIALMATFLALALAVGIWVSRGTWIALAPDRQWIEQVRAPWIPQFGIEFSLTMDGLSLLMILLTTVLGVVSVAISWTEIRDRVGFFHFNTLWILAGVTGVFLAVDLFLFYFFWEMMLVPMYFLIGIWGHERRQYASMKFFIFTQASGLLMLLAILGLAFAHYSVTGVLTFSYQDLLGTPMGRATSTILMLGFFIAFAVKLPAFPFHPWLPDAHTEAPTAGSVILAGLMLKTGAYGLIRFVQPLFHDAAMRFAPIAMLLGVIGIVYGAVLAFGQSDLKRLVAYTSVSHLGFVLLGIFAWNELALQGAIMEMLCHGLSTGALFVLAGALQERVHSRDMDRMGGLWENIPRMGAAGMFFALASLGLPGIGNFVGEFLILFGAFRVRPVLTIIAAAGLIGAMVYSLWFVHKVFFREKGDIQTLDDLTTRHVVVLGSMMVMLLWLGLYPQPVLDTAGAAVTNIESLSTRAIRRTVALTQYGPTGSDAR